MNTFSRNWLKAQKNIIKTASHVLFIQPGGQKKFLITPRPNPPSPKSPFPPPLAWTKTIQAAFQYKTYLYLKVCVKERFEYQRKTYLYN